MPNEIKVLCTVCTVCSAELTKGKGFAVDDQRILQHIVWKYSVFISTFVLRTLRINNNFDNLVMEIME